MDSQDFAAHPKRSERRGRRRRRRLPDAAGAGSGETTRLISIPYDVITGRREVGGGRRKEGGRRREREESRAELVRNNGGRGMNKWRNRGIKATERTRGGRSESMRGAGKLSRRDIVKL